MLTLSKEEFYANVKKLDEAIKRAERVLKSSSIPIKRSDKVDNVPGPKRIPRLKVLTRECRNG